MGLKDEFRPMISWLIGWAAVLLFDFLAWKIVRAWAPTGYTRPARWVYILLSLPLYTLMLMVALGGRQAVDRQTLFVLACVLFPVLAFKLAVFLIYPFQLLPDWWMRRQLRAAPPDRRVLIDRRRFLQKAALSLAALPAGAMLYGIIRGGSRLQVYRHSFVFPDLPEAFHGLRIVQLSDIHTGSFLNGALLEEAVERIRALQPDLICFTGDLVNNFTNEVAPFKNILGRLHAPLGIYSILGNHDYGDYVRWDDPARRRANFEAMLRTHREMGWRLLRNEHALIDRRGETLPIIGVENWSSYSRFPKYGDLQKAAAGTENYPFCLLLSHDPTHWDAQVQNQAYRRIGLTLSGHTHGMQFGVETPFIKWSPVQWVYPRWAGAYQEGPQSLYVNRGLGFIGYPGRVGIWPEISLLELKKAPGYA